MKEFLAFPIHNIPFFSYSKQPKFKVYFTEYMQTKPYIIYLKTNIKSRTKTKKGQIYITITKKTQKLIDFYKHNNNNVSEID